MPCVGSAFLFNCIAKYIYVPCSIPDTKLRATIQYSCESNSGMTFLRCPLMNDNNWPRMIEAYLTTQLLSLLFNPDVQKLKRNFSTKTVKLAECEYT